MRSDPIESRQQRFYRRDRGRGRWRGDSWARSLLSSEIKQANTTSSNARFGEDDWFRITVSLAFNNNNNNNNTTTIFMVLSSWRSAIARVHPVHMMNADSAPGGRQPSDQANRLGL